MNELKILKTINEQKKLKDEDILLIVKRRIRYSNYFTLSLLAGCFYVILFLNGSIFTYLINNGINIFLSFYLLIFKSSFDFAVFLLFFIVFYGAFNLGEYLFNPQYNKEKKLIKRIRDKING